MTAKTNGSKPAPNREEVIRIATYHAAVYGWYDTRQDAQHDGTLTISVVDMSSMERLPANTTHKFFILVNATAYMVVRYADDHYEVTGHDQTERHREEREMRTTVLDYALWYMTGEGAGYHPSQGPEARAAAIKELLEEGLEEETEERDPTATYPVIRDVAPDIFYAPGDQGQAPPRVSRQWVVQIGPHNVCEVGLLGYNLDGTPELVAIDVEETEEGGYFTEDFPPEAH